MSATYFQKPPKGIVDGTMQECEPSNSDITNNIDFLAAGISVIPLKLDGSKSPSIASWKDYQTRLPTENEIRTWFRTVKGSAVICGVVSGGLEVLDFDYDAENIFPAWSEMVGDILCWLPVVETPSGGYHVYYRCNVICGNQKIAKPAEEKKPFIESRGEGGYVVSVVSPEQVHALNYPYIQVAGPVLPDVPTITSDERKTLWQAAATFDQSEIRKAIVKKIAAKRERRRQSGGKLTPWDDYNSRGDWFEVLQRHGWTSTDGIHWRHPNAEPCHKHSATLRQATTTGDTVLHVFSTSTALEAEKSHSLFNFVKVMDYSGDAAKTTRELRNAGYGK